MVNREEAIKRLMRELSDVKLLPDVSDQLEQVLREADPQAGRKKVLEEHGGISSYLRHLVTCECQQPSSQSYLSGYKPLQIMDACDYINYVCTLTITGTLWEILFFIALIEGNDRRDLIDELWLLAFNLVSLGFSCSALKYRFKCYGGGTGSGEGSSGGSKDDGGAEITYESR